LENISVNGGHAVLIEIDYILLIDGDPLGILTLNSLMTLFLS
jgi:hypothetical protein